MSSFAPSPTPTAGPRASWHEWLGLAVLALPTIIIGLDFTVLHLAASRISADLQPSSSELLWIVDIYGFMIAGLLITMGTLGDRIGRRRLLLLGASLFGVVSVVAAFSTSPAMLIACRALLGLTGATLMPSTLSLISNMFHDAAQRGLAIAVWMTSFMIGGAIGPIAGGALLDHFWWGSAFLLAVPVMVVLLVLGPVLLPEHRDPNAGRLDMGSVALSLGAILPVIFGIKELATHGITAAPIVAILAGAALGVIFVRRQRTLTDPMLDLSLFSRRAFSASLGTQTLTVFIIGSTQFLILQYLQLVHDLTPLQAGVWTLPSMAAGAAGTLAAPTLARHSDPHRVMIASLVLSLAGFGMVAQAAASSALVLTVAGYTVVMLALNPVLALTYDLIVGTAPPERAGSASGMAETGTELGIASGVAIIGSVATAVYRGRVSGDVLPEGVPPDVAASARETLGGAVAEIDRVPPHVADELLDVTRDAFASGLITAAVINGLLGLALAIVVRTTFRRRGRHTDRATDLAIASSSTNEGA